MLKPYQLLKLQHKDFPQVWMPCELMAYPDEESGTAVVRLIVGKSWSLVEVAQQRLGVMDEADVTALCAEWGDFPLCRVDGRGSQLGLTEDAPG